MIQLLSDYYEYTNMSLRINGLVTQYPVVNSRKRYSYVLMYYNKRKVEHVCYFRSICQRYMFLHITVSKS